MKLTGDLKKIVYNSKTREEAKTAIEDAGMILNDEELDEVSGGCICIGPKCMLKLQILLTAITAIRNSVRSGKVQTAR